MNFKVALLIVYLFGEFEHICGEDVSYLITLEGDSPEIKTKLKQAYEQVESQLFYRLSEETKALITANHNIRKFEAQTLAQFIPFDSFRVQNNFQLWQKTMDSYLGYTKSKNKVMTELIDNLI